MAFIIDDDFQSYTVGQPTPFGNLFQGGVVNPFISVDVPGIFGDTNSVTMPAIIGLIWPTQTPSSSLPAFQQLSLFMGLWMGHQTDQIGTLIEFANNLTPAAGGNMGFLLCNSDGTLTFTVDGGAFLLSDYSLLTEKWYWIQVNVSYSTNGSGLVVMDVNVAVNNLSVMSGTLTTNRHASDFPTLFVNNIRLGGCSGGSRMGRLTVSDTILPIGTNPHAGTPVALVSQGVIELIKAPSGTLPSIPACILGSGATGDFYDQTFSVVGGVAPYTWSLASGSGPLPPGLTLNPTTGEVKGTLITAGSFSYTVQVTDAIGNTSTKDCSISVSGLSACAERFGPKLYFWEPSFLERPEDTFLRATDWEDAGYDGLKFVQGLIVEADTEGQDRNLLIQGDQQDIEIIPINHAGQLMNAYSFTIPYEAHMLRVIPQDPDFWRLFNIRWVFEPAPEYVYEWKTQGTDHDMAGYQFLKDGFIAHRSTADLTLTITVDGSVFVYTIPNSGGVYRKTYILFALANTGLALKGKLFTYQLRSTNVNVPFQLYQKDSEIRVHAWSGGGYSVKLPFGDVSRISGAKL